MSIEDSKLCIPELKIPAGFLLDTSFLGISIRVPPSDIVVMPKLCVDLKPIWDVIMSILDAMTAEFYKKIEEEK